MTTTDTGRKAEDVAAKYLEKLDYKILGQNWKTRTCEVDIVAQKSKTIYFVEVKYRQTVQAGSGLEYITPQKLSQMAYAAEQWVADHNWQRDYCLSAVEVSGPKFEITNFIDTIN